MPRLDPRLPLRQGQLPTFVRKPTSRLSEDPVSQTDYLDLINYIDRLVGALENYRHDFASKLEIKSEVNQATTTALAAVVWDDVVFDNGGWWTVTTPTVLTAPTSGMYTGVFQTKLDGAGSIRVQLFKNGGANERGMDVTLAGDFTFAFAWQDYYLVGDEIEVHVSTSGSRNLVGEWTRCNLHHLDFVEAT